MNRSDSKSGEGAVAHFPLNVEADDEATSIQAGRPEPPALADVDPDTTAVSSLAGARQSLSDERSKSLSLDAESSPGWDDGVTLDTQNEVDSAAESAAERSTSRDIGALSAARAGAIEDHTDEGTGMTLRQPSQAHHDTLDIIGEETTGVTERSVVEGMQAPARTHSRPPVGSQTQPKSGPASRRPGAPSRPARSAGRTTRSSSSPDSRSPDSRPRSGSDDGGKATPHRTPQQTKRKPGSPPPPPPEAKAKAKAKAKANANGQRRPAPSQRRKPASQTVAEMFAPDTLDTDDVTEASKVPASPEGLAREINSGPLRPGYSPAAESQRGQGRSARPSPGSVGGLAPGNTRPESQSDHPARSAFDGISKRGHGAAGATRNDDLVGIVLLERYQVVRRVGRGGMSQVYLGRHTTINKDVAIKVLAPQLAEWPVYVERFLQEARAASMIRHPNVVDINDFGYTEGDDKLPFFVMEYLAGEDLRDRLAREGRLDWVHARPVLLQICAALDAAHRKGVIHRDIKPENVFIIQQDDGSELIKLLDFGIAKVASETEPGSLTSHGVVLGTVDYISPERANKENVDTRADIYSLGVLVYRMVTGKLPFTGDAVDIVTSHVYDKPPLPSQVAPKANISPELERAIVRALAKKPDDRFQTINEFAAALQAVPMPGMGDVSGLYGPQRSATLPPLPRATMPGYERPVTIAPGQMQTPFAGNQDDRSSSRFWLALLVGITIVVLLAVIIALLLRQDNGSDPSEPSDPSGWHQELHSTEQLTAIFPDDDSSMARQLSQQISV